MARAIKLKIGRFVVQISIGRLQTRDAETYGRKLDLGYAQTLERRFPELLDFGLSVTEDNATEVAEFYASYLPLISDDAKSASARSMLHTMAGKTADAALKKAAAISIAKSNLVDGLAERGLILKGSKPWESEVVLWEAAYGAPIITTDWHSASRAKSLLHYFSAHPDLLAGKEILHIAPEMELEKWLCSAESGAKRYVSMDGQFAAAERHDITSLGYSTGSFDLIICHRVMEHVLDDVAGFSELFRVLRPGGLLNFSVPQAPQRAATKEWTIPDKSHDGHVRQYGADLTKRMNAAGFGVDMEPWLLSRPHDELRSVNAYPMRMYNARKPS